MKECYVLTAEDYLGEWEVIGFTYSATYPVEIVDRLSKQYGANYYIQANLTELVE